MSILLVLRQRDAHVAPRALTRHGERDGGADTSRLEEVPDVVLRAYRLAIHGDDAIAQDHAARARQLRAGEPGLRGGAVGLHLGQRHAVRHADGLVEALGDEGGADARLDGAPSRDELRHEPRDRVDRNREADPGRRPARAEDRGADADEPAAGVEQRAARVSGIDGGVGLDDVADAPPARRAQLAPERAHHPRGEGMVEAERVTDRVDVLADQQRARSAGRQRRQVLARRADLQHGQVLLGCGADHARLPLRLVRERHREGVALLDHVEVRDHVTLAVPDEAAARPRRDLLHVEREEATAQRQARDEDDRRPRAAEDLDRAPPRGARARGWMRRCPPATSPPGVPDRPSPMIELPSRPFVGSAPARRVRPPRATAPALASAPAVPPAPSAPEEATAAWMLSTYGRGEAEARARAALEFYDAHSADGRY